MKKFKEIGCGTCINNPRLLNQDGDCQLYKTCLIPGQTMVKLYGYLSKYNYEYNNWRPDQPDYLDEDLFEI